MSGEDYVMVTPKDLLKWSLDGHCTIRTNFQLQSNTVVGSRPNQCKNLNDEALKDFFPDEQSEEPSTLGNEK